MFTSVTFQIKSSPVYLLTPTESQFQILVSLNLSLGGQAVRDFLSTHFLSDNYLLDRDVLVRMVNLQIIVLDETKKIDRNVSCFFCGTHSLDHCFPKDVFFFNYYNIKSVFTAPGGHTSWFFFVTSLIQRIRTRSLRTCTVHTVLIEAHKSSCLVKIAFTSQR